ncbi:MAG: hypothetical protein OIF32_11850 [Campylobacterales bacterium]|nr:hypothetical protein [Campylobacterales bacterium]
MSADKNEIKQIFDNTLEGFKGQIFVKYFENDFSEYLWDKIFDDESIGTLKVREEFRDIPEEELIEKIDFELDCLLMPTE